MTEGNLFRSGVSVPTAKESERGEEPGSGRLVRKRQKSILSIKMSAFDRLVALKQRGSLIESALSVYLMDRVPSYLPGLPSTRKKAVPSSLL